MKITPITYARSTLPEKMIFPQGGTGKREIVFTVFLIETAERKILVDAGCETMPGFDMRNFVSPITALMQHRILPDQITDLILTHAHHDHAECTKYFKKAKVYINTLEYPKARKHIPDNFEVILFEGEKEVCKGVSIITIGGHSVGSSIVQITDKGQKYIITGDECYLRENLTSQIPTASTVDPDKSRAFVQKYSSGYTVLLCHDI